MEYRTMNIKVISAEGIKDVNMFSKMDVYAAVSLEGYPQSMKKTFVDKDCGTHPKWNHSLDFVVDEPYLTKPGLSILFQLKSESTIGSDKEIGSVSVRIDELFNSNSSSEDRIVEYQVKTSSGKSKGTLKFGYNFGEKFTHKVEEKKHVEEPMKAYPAASPYAVSGGPSYAVPAGYPPHQYPPQQYPPGAYGGYPPQQYGYQQPPPPGYGYPPPAAGYGAYPGAYPAGQKPKKNKMGGMGGMGLGLGAGLLGGLLVGEMVSDVGDAAAYADGYGDAMDGGGFDF